MERQELLYALLALYTNDQQTPYYQKLKAFIMQHTAHEDKIPALLKPIPMEITNG